MGTLFVFIPIFLSRDLWAKFLTLKQVFTAENKSMSGTSINYLN